MRYRVFTTLACIAVVVGTGCKQETAKTAPTPPAVTVAKPLHQKVVDFTDYTGRFATGPNSEVEIKARVRGYLDKINFKDGQDVTKDQVLFEIDPRPFRVSLQLAEGQLAQITARQKTAEADVARYKDLVPKGAATQQDLDKAVGQLAESVAGIQAATAEVERAKLDLVFAKITSPIEGKASKSTLNEGDLVGSSATETTLTTIVKMDPIYVYFDVDERAVQIYRARAGMERPSNVRDLNIRINVGLTTEEGYPHEGVVDFIDNVVNTNTGTILLRAEIPNPQRVFLPGFFARIRVPAGDPYEGILVSDVAIGTQQETKYVLVVDDKNVVKIRPVKLGPLQPGGLRVILEGLTKDDWVIVNGIQRARPEAPVTPQKGEMPVRLPKTRPAASQPASTQPASTAPAK